MANTRNAKILEVLPNARYRVETDTHDKILAHVSGDMRMKLIRLLPGDEVTVEVSPFDPNHARIVHRSAHRSENDADAQEQTP